MEAALNAAYGSLSSGRSAKESIVTVGAAAQQSRIASSGQLRMAGTSSDIRIQNIAVSGTPISESPCATNSTWTNVNGAPTNCN
jgi:hypothetical protein